FPDIDPLLHRARLSEKAWLSSRGLPDAWLVPLCGCRSRRRASPPSRRAEAGEAAPGFAVHQCRASADQEEQDQALNLFAAARQLLRRWWRFPLYSRPPQAESGYTAAFLVRHRPAGC